jgi:hypothetical protein
MIELAGFLAVALVAGLVGARLGMLIGARLTAVLDRGDGEETGARDP